MLLFLAGMLSQLAEERAPSTKLCYWALCWTGAQRQSHWTFTLLRAQRVIAQSKNSYSVLWVSSINLVTFKCIIVALTICKRHQAISTEFEPTMFWILFSIQVKLQLLRSEIEFLQSCIFFFFSFSFLSYFLIFKGHDMSSFSVKKVILSQRLSFCSVFLVCLYGPIKRQGKSLKCKIFLDYLLGSIICNSHIAQMHT